MGKCDDLCFCSFCVLSEPFSSLPCLDKSIKMPVAYLQKLEDIVCFSKRIIKMTPLGIFGLFCISTLMLAIKVFKFVQDK